MKSQKIILALLISLSALSAQAGDGRGGTDGDKLHPEVYSLASYSDAYLQSIQKLAGHYIVMLQYKQGGVETGLRGDTSIPSVVFQNNFLIDIFITPKYEIHDEVGACGRNSKGSPLPLSTRNGVSGDTVCIDRPTIFAHQMSLAQLVGAAIHEHCRHVSGCQDENQTLLNAVAANYMEVVKYPLRGTCLATETEGITAAVLGPASDLWRSRPQIEDFDFYPAELLNGSSSTGDVLRAKPITKVLRGSVVELKAYSELNSGFANVTLTLDGKSSSVSVALDEFGSGFATFEFLFRNLSVSNLRTQVTCEVYKNRSGPLPEQVSTVLKSFGWE